MTTLAADKYDEVERLLDTALDEDATNGIFRCRRDIFTNADLFELEMKHIFEANWVYLAHESQIPEINDYYTTWIGRQPVVITRDKNGELHAIINACAHKGAMLCRRKHGNKGSFTCPFHGWTFSNTGKLLKVKDEKTTEYPVSFNKNGSHDLTRVARFQNYRGFLFGSLSDDVLPLEDYLGETRVIIDQIVDQAPTAWKSARQLQLHLRRQLEDADGKRLRRLPRQLRALELRRHHGPPQGRRHQGRRRQRLEQGCAVSTASRTATSCCGPTRSTRKCARSGTSAKNSPPAWARRAPIPSWPRPATCACIPTCS
jgi:nitrite reductase/ring-hydroxylating ferredoxin subunit